MGSDEVDSIAEGRSEIGIDDLRVPRRLVVAAGLVFVAVVIALVVYATVGPGALGHRTMEELDGRSFTASPVEVANLGVDGPAVPATLVFGRDSIRLDIDGCLGPRWIGYELHGATMLPAGMVLEGPAVDCDEVGLRTHRAMSDLLMNRSPEVELLGDRLALRTPRATIELHET